MNKEMIVCSNAHETRVAILEDDLVAEIFVEREHQRGVVGNIYKGRVSKVLPGMQSAFVDIGLERDAFLYVTDVISPADAVERFETDDDVDEPQGESAPDPAEAAQAAHAEREDAEAHDPAEDGAAVPAVAGDGDGNGRAQAASRGRNGRAPGRPA